MKPVTTLAPAGLPALTSAASAVPKPERVRGTIESAEHAL